MTYDVTGYASQRDFDIPLAERRIEGLTRKREALREGRLWLAEFPVVKVQSADREFITVLRRPLGQHSPV